MRKHRHYGIVLVLLSVGGMVIQPGSENSNVAAAVASGHTSAVHTSAAHPAVGSDPRPVPHDRHRRHGTAYHRGTPTGTRRSEVDRTDRRRRAAHERQLRRFFTALLLRRYVAAVAANEAAVAAATPPAPAPAVPVASGDVWAELRQCESGGNYGENTGNGYYGAYQFALGTWQALGYGGLPSDAPPAVQDQAAQELQARAGWGQWPACSAKLGL
ncbi:MAG TPA: transglycosylase family protein [Acidimicrobiales bacterium]|nr:transglycosylase family protein [Acidimicrobiales bacterium]